MLRAAFPLWLVFLSCLGVTAAAFPAASARAQAAAVEQDDEDTLRLRGELEVRDRVLTRRLRAFSVMAPLMTIPIPLLVAKYFWSSDGGHWSQRARLAIGWRFAFAGAGILTGVVGALVSGTRRHRERRRARALRVAPVVSRARGERGGGAVLALEF